MVDELLVWLYHRLLHDPTLPRTSGHLCGEGLVVPSSSTLESRTKARRRHTIDVMAARLAQTLPRPVPTATPLLQAQNVHRFLGSGEARTEILKGVDLSIGRGEYVSIVGASGSGKSTLLYLLGGLDRPDRRDAAEKPITPESAVFIDGENTHELSDTQLALVRNAKVGFVFQFHYLLKEFTAAENIALPMFKLGRLTRDEAMSRAVNLLDQFGLAGKAKRRANRLSGGEQQRVAIARALANEPAVLLADEPTGNLDRKNSEVVADIFQQLAACGQTIVMVTHDQQFAHRARRIVTMEDGNVVADQQIPKA